MSMNRIWTFGAAAAIIAVLALGWLIGISPKLTEMDATAASLESVQTQNTEQEARLASLKAQYENIGALRDQLADMQAQLPADPEIEVYLEELSELAAGTGVAIDSFTAAEGVAYDEAGAAVEGAAPVDPAVATANVGGVFTIPITVAVSGTAQQVLDFTGAAQEGTRLFIVDSVTFSSEGEDAGGTISGFVFVVRSAAAAAPVADAPDETALAAG